MTTYITYKYYCETEQKFIKETIPSASSVPSICKNNGSHTIDTESLTLYRQTVTSGLTGNPMSSVVGVGDSQTLTNKTISATDNTITGLTPSDVGLDNVQNIQHKLDGTSAPSVSDDSSAGYSIASTWIDVTNDKVYICVDSSVGAAQWKDVSSSAGSTIFGSEFQYITSITESATTNTAWQQKVRMTTTTLPSGTYRIGWSFSWGADSRSYDFKSQIQLNDTSTIMSMNEELKDPDSYVQTGGYYYSTLSGVNTIDLDWSTENSSMTARLKDVHLELWRVL